MDVLSVSDAFMYALEAVGKEYQYIASGQAVLRTVPEIMEVNGWYAMKNTAGEILYYTRPAQAVLETGVKTYTEVAEVTAVTTESGAVTGATVTTTGVGATVATSALACAVTASYGYNIGNQIYDVNPEFWDGMLEEVNEWTVENVPEGGVNAIVTVLDGVDSVLTFPQSLLDRIKSYSIEKGVYDVETNIDYNIPTSTGTAKLTFGAWSPAYVQKALQFSIKTSTNSDNRKKLEMLLNYMTTIYAHVMELVENTGNKYNVMWVSTSSSSISFNFFNLSEEQNIKYDSSDGLYYVSYRTPAGDTCFNVNVFNNDDFFNPTYNAKLDNSTSIRCYIGEYTYAFPNVTLMTLNNINAIDISESSKVDGVSLQSDATYPSNDSPISETYPDWWNKVLTINNGSGGSTNWLPLSITDKNAEYFGDPQTQAEAQSGTKTKTENSNIQIVDTSGALDIPNNPPTDDKGTTPVLFPPTSIFGIAGIYNPTLTELRAFSNWLWSADPITQLAQMFNNPMNGIIGLHSIYVTPHTDGSKTIGVGYLSSGVQSKVVDEQYVTIDCGSVEIPSYFNNVNDWSPYTKISCYLPFIGIVDLNTDDIMSSADKQCTINITYKVDVLTGACLCMIRVKRGSIDGVLYQYNGSCSVQLPLTSGNYGTMIASLITTAVGVGTGVGAIAVGGALSALHSKANVQRSGQLGANVGAMGIKKPYLIIERPYSKYAGSYAKHIGYPSNNTVTLSSCKGFTRVKASDVTNINTTEEERNMIYELLKNGVYV